MSDNRQESPWHLARQAGPLEGADEGEVRYVEPDFLVECRDHLIDKRGMPQDVALQIAEFPGNRRPTNSRMPSSM